MTIPEPTNAQAMFISTIVGAGAAFFGYMLVNQEHQYQKVKNNGITITR